MRRIISHLSLLFSLIIITSVTGCKSTPQLKESVSRGNVTSAEEYLDALIRAQMREHRIPGMAVAVVHEGKILFSRFYGKAHDKKDTPLIQGAAFMAGSLSKSFTAMAVSNLIHDGKIDPDADIKTYLPGFSIKSWEKQERPITVRHLLTHTSGLPIDYYARFTGERNFSAEALLSRLGEEYLCFQPGTAVKYSNIGYKLVGMIVERVAGKSFENYMRETVFSPAGMNGSAYNKADVGVTATGHDGNRRNKVIPMIDIRDNPSSGLFTTIRDLTSFLSYLSGEGDASGISIPGPEAVNSVIKNADFSIDTFYDSMNIYTTGWYLGFYDFPGVRHVLSNSGNVNGFSSELTYIPEAKLGMAVLSNSSLGWKADIVIADRGLRAYLKALGISSDTRENTYERKLSLSPPPADVTGRYAAFGFNVNIYRKRGKLRAKFTGPATRLNLIENGLYGGKVCILFACIDVAKFTEYDDIRFRFYTNREGETFLSVEPSYGKTYFYFPLHRVKKPDIPDGFNKNYGVWKLTAQTDYPDILKLYLRSDTFTVYEKNGWPLMETKTWMGKGTLVLFPLTADLARIAGSGEIISFKNNQLDFIGLTYKKNK